jgi:RNA recognition motif. (a.k.a. RRM, RBD, or RNP domain)
MAKKLYVGPIRTSVTERDLTRLFAQYGTVTKAQIPIHPVLGCPMGFAFVEMAGGADDAIAALNGTKFKGSVLTVNEARGPESQSRKPTGISLPFLDALIASFDTKFFRVLDSSAENPVKWELEPLDTDLLSDSDSDGLHVMKALNLLPDGAIRACYMDMNLPERTTDYAFFVENGSLRYGRHHEFPREILPAVAIDCFGVYELFYSKQRPQLGIDILKRGLAIAKRKHYIAEDLGYIFRDERRFREAADMFQIAVEEGPSSYFIYGELAGAYAELGDSANEQKYDAMFKQHSDGG